ncbi:NAD(P)/FAD-dependent oxidoreductase, partial [Desulfovibrio sp.]
MKNYDAVVIGGGPAGMTAALYLLRAGASVALVEKLSPGGQILMTSEIENYPGFPKGIKGYELADLMAEQVGVHPHDTLNDEVREIRSEGKRHQILVGSDWIEAKAVILCSGARYRKLGVPGEEAFIGRGVSYCALCDGNFFRDRVVAVVGGGNSALEEALYLSRLVKKLHLIHRRDEFRGCKCYQDKCFTHPKMEILRSSAIREVRGDSEVRSVLVENVKSGESREIAVDGVFV